MICRLKAPSTPSFRDGTLSLQCLRGQTMLSEILMAHDALKLFILEITFETKLFYYLILIIYI